MASPRIAPLNALRSFEAAARLLSFSLAARELFVTPAAISHQIKRLEEHLGVELFVRRHRVVTLTAAGARLSDRVTEIFASIDQAMRAAVKAPPPAIRVSALPSLAAKWLAPRLHRFERLHPSIRVHVHTSDHLVNFNDQAFDIGLRYGPGGYRGVQAQPWMTADIVPVCSPALLKLKGKPLKTPSALRHHTLLHDESSLQSDGVPNWSAWLAQAGATGVDAQRGPIFGSIHLAIEAALAGHGIALAPAPLVEDDLINGRLVRPFALPLRNAYGFWIVAPKRGSGGARVAKFLRWLRDEAAPFAPPA